MTNMKTDMGGSAAVLGAFLALVSAPGGLPPAVGELSCTLCVAENAIGSRAYHNDDIVLLKSGKSVEVMNTDAEGRIVLADGIYHASGELPVTPDVIIDMATLTGAQGVACGLRHAGLYSNEGGAEAALLAAGRRSGDTCWPVLYCPEYHAANYVSPCADLRNIQNGKPDASVSLGGYFVEANLAPRFKGALLHVDLAFPSFDTAGATGFGVALATTYVEEQLQ
ncbi:aminopeptidase [Strigomonas culicis]|uniref:Aminopeptidase n=1 Tax=Strigomonas culicis TaxID=28005 RepID=S9TUX7_9TRYP|nr:aminopeptidase [Strigomonas culicis]|eukprot:EPY22227.1 aminopeptidase [Strigomonas culicis]